MVVFFCFCRVCVGPTVGTITCQVSWGDASDNRRRTNWGSKGVITTYMLASDVFRNASGYCGGFDLRYFYLRRCFPSRWRSNPERLSELRSRYSLPSFSGISAKQQSLLSRDGGAESQAVTPPDPASLELHDFRRPGEISIGAVPRPRLGSGESWDLENGTQHKWGNKT